MRMKPILSPVETLPFVVRCDPPTTTHQAHARIMKRKDGTLFIGKPASSKGAKLRRSLVNAFRLHAPLHPIDVPAECQIVLEWDWLKSDPKYVREYGIIAAMGRSDGSNLAKLLEDSLVDAGFFTNDNRISDLIIRKRRGDYPGIYIKVSEPDLFPYHHTWNSGK